MRRVPEAASPSPAVEAGVAVGPSLLAWVMKKSTSTASTLAPTSTSARRPASDGGRTGAPVAATTGAGTTGVVSTTGTLPSNVVSGADPWRACPHW